MYYVWAAMVVQFLWLAVQFLAKDEETAMFAFRINITIMGVLVLGGLFRVLGNP